MRNLEQCDRPDLIATLPDKLVIVEHFAFDGSKETSKGMKGIKREKEIEATKNKYYESTANHELIVPVDYKRTLADLVNNFNLHFGSHYSKIDEYKNRVLERYPQYKEDQIVVGFFIENEWPPVVMINKKFYPIVYTDTKQFNDLFFASHNLDFVIWGGIVETKEMYYCDHQCCLAKEKQLDLFSEDIVFSRINNTLIDYSSQFEMDIL